MDFINNNEKIEYLIKQYGRDIFSFCKKLAGGYYDGEDLYQQTFLKAMVLSEQIDVDKNPKSFLISIAINEMRNQKRKFSRRQKIAPTIPITELEEFKLAATDNVEEKAIQNEQNEFIRGIINTLPEKQRTVILLFYSCDYKIEQIASICDCPAGTVKSRLNKARSKIKKELEDLGYGTN